MQYVYMLYSSILDTKRIYVNLCNFSNSDIESKILLILKFKIIESEIFVFYSIIINLKGLLPLQLRPYRNYDLYDNYGFKILCRL